MEIWRSMYYREVFSGLIGSPFIMRDIGSRTEGILTEKDGMKFFRKIIEI